jgi:hypothetical protein
MVRTYLAVATSTLSDMDRAVCVTYFPTSHHFLPVRWHQRMPGGQLNPLALRPRVEMPSDSIPLLPTPLPPSRVILFFIDTAVRELASSYVCTQEERRYSPAVTIGRLAAGHIWSHRCHGGAAIVFPPARSYPGMERDRERDQNRDRDREEGGNEIHRWDNCGT